MFSYRHAFHAGNHADVLKHAIVVYLLRHLAQKDAPYWVIDTHAGAGAYALEDEWAEKNAEYETGIARIWERDDLPEMIADYLKQVDAFNEDGTLRYYPGSPFIAAQLLRERDRLRLFELHPTEIDVLRKNVQSQGRDVARRTMIYAADGFEGIKALLPPPTRRGLVLLDPSYEDKRDYARVVQSVKDGLERFATGCYAVWYPQVARNEAIQLPERLAKLPVKSWVHAALTVQSPSGDGLGLNGSGMFILNPPWTLAAALKDTLPWLTEALGQDDGAKYTLEFKEG
ncbi:ribosomal RNA large subunit methyltransferase J [Pigmentiphaga litoralis]|uniref:23S rRNA (adenine(2030)-N(6))-methyltransferase RlmJ n=1 Tax=Pigmentiphaga litoralis TaxID=516702 RepID=UPI001678782B|nr:23S rRNA (adenine(2030)-N(6))-methyltransferase RlmJ [Pigmentiphaga litoralis]GGX34450.1 ribosomal RNA large subunit methyltransferase J [Pigmentiphaga litoralis]